MAELVAWLPKHARVWGNGPLFDVAILEHAYRHLVLPVPWDFWHVRDCRTLLDMFECQRGGLNNAINLKAGRHALNNAMQQANAVCKMWIKLVRTHS